MATENAPLLLGDQCTLPTDDIYERFTYSQKRTILTIVSLAGLVPTFVGGCFVPSIPQVSKDLEESPAAVSLAISLSVLASSFGVMFWSAYSSYYGRRVVYIYGIPFTILGSFATAVSPDLNSLLFWRFVQTFGCSGGLSVGAAAIGDIYKLEERGAAMGTFFGAALIGLAISPPLGGVAAQYLSWRGFQAALGVWSMIQMLLLFFFFPETTHPGTRGVDREQGSRKIFVCVNPFRCIALLRSPNILAITLSSTFALLTDFTLLIPIAYTIGAKYGITSEGLIGLLCLPNGVGNFVGAPIAGYISDRAVRKAKVERKGVWVPEDRLRAAWLGGLVLIPISVTLAGFTTAYVDGPVGLIICLACLFFNGIGVDLVLAPIGAYAVDIMPSRSAEVMAAVSALRSLCIAPVSALYIPSVQTIGVAATNSIAGLFALFGQGLIWLTIRYGKQMRAWADVGYPSFEDEVRD